METRTNHSNNICPRWGRLFMPATYFEMTRGPQFCSSFQHFFSFFKKYFTKIVFFLVKPLQSKDIKSWVRGEFQFNCPIIYGYLLFGFVSVSTKNQLKDKINYLRFGDFEISFVVLILALVGSISFHYGPQYI